jgi:hypothetical protein
MVFSRYHNPSILNFVFASILYLFTRCRKCHSLYAAGTAPSSSLLIGGIPTITANTSDEQRLFYTLMTGYEKAVRPIRKASDVVVVKLGITLTQIMDIVSNEIEYFVDLIFYIKDERNQIMTTNIWLDQVRICQRISSQKNLISVQCFKHGTNSVFFLLHKRNGLMNFSNGIPKILVV